MDENQVVVSRPAATPFTLGASVADLEICPPTRIQYTIWQTPPIVIKDISGSVKSHHQHGMVVHVENYSWQNVWLFHCPQS